MKNSTKKSSVAQSAVTSSNFGADLPATVTADVTPIWKDDIENGIKKSEEGYEASKLAGEFIRKAFGVLKSGKLDLSFEDYELRRKFSLECMRLIPRFRSLDDKSQDTEFARLMKMAYCDSLSLIVPKSVKADAVRIAEGRAEVVKKAEVLVKDNTPEQLIELQKTIAVERVTEGLKPETKKELGEKAKAVETALKIKKDTAKKVSDSNCKGYTATIKEFLNDPDTTEDQLKDVADYVSNLL
jgi:hypothetical protein